MNKTEHSFTLVHTNFGSPLCILVSRNPWHSFAEPSLRNWLTETAKCMCVSKGPRKTCIKPLTSDLHVSLRPRVVGPMRYDVMQFISNVTAYNEWRNSVLSDRTNTQHAWLCRSSLARPLGFHGWYCVLWQVRAQEEETLSIKHIMHHTTTDNITSIDEQCLVCSQMTDKSGSGVASEPYGNPS